MVKDIKLGTTQVQKAYVGTSLMFEYVPPDITAPITAMRPYDEKNNPNRIYDSAQTIWFDTNEPSDTYYTTDGSTPTTASTKYVGNGIPIDKTTTFKYFSVDRAGNQEPVKETTYTINNVVATGWRYLKVEGYGSVEEPTTTRIIELEVWEGTTNHMTNATIVSHDPINTGGTIDTIRDGVKELTGYPIWWVATPNANIVIDLNAQRNLTKLNYYSYATANVLRANRFRILASNTNNGTDWTPIWDMSTNTTVQPAIPNGYEKVL